MPVGYSNKSIKKPHLELDYTSDMILNIEKCKNDFFYFCNYIKIVHPDKGKIKFEPRDYQIDILNKIIANRNFVGLASRQVGKCVYGDTTVKIRSKATGEIKEVHIKDFYNNFDQMFGLYTWVI